MRAAAYARSDAEWEGGLAGGGLREAAALRGSRWARCGSGMRCSIHRMFGAAERVLMAQEIGALPLRRAAMQQHLFQRVLQVSPELAEVAWRPVEPQAAQDRRDVANLLLHVSPDLFAYLSLQPSFHAITSSSDRFRPRESARRSPRTRGLLRVLADHSASCRPPALRYSQAPPRREAG